MRPKSSELTVTRAPSALDQNASEFAKGVENAGAVFVGARTTEAVGIIVLDRAMFCPQMGPQDSHLLLEFMISRLVHQLLNAPERL